MSCTVDPSDAMYCGEIPIQARATDEICGAADSETETYAKVTTISASDNP